MDEEAQFLAAIQTLDPGDLIQIVVGEAGGGREHIEQSISEGRTDQLGRQIGRLLDMKREGIVRKGGPTVFMAASMWGRVKNEMHLLLCTNDKKYSSLRSSLAKQGHATNVVVVGAIAGAVGASIGAVAASVVPLVALILAAVLRIGKEAYCAEFKERP